MRPQSQTRAGRRLLAIFGAFAVPAGIGLLAGPAAASTVTAPTPAPPVPAPALAPVATAARATVAVHHDRLNVVSGAHAFVSGRLSPRGRGHVVVLQRLLRGHWHTVARDATDHAGQFRLSLHVALPGTSTVRVRVHRDATVLGGQRTLGHLNVFHRVLASWYGPGLFGGPLACGGVLGFGTLGVANKTLPCGTKVTLRYRGRTVRVPVIDRGPYAGGRDYDLTEATKEALGFGDVGVVEATR